MALKHPRVSEDGQTFGRLTALMAERGQRLLVDQGLSGLALPGMRDAMCASCACRAGTVPNGCLQTQLDLLKAVVEGQKFLCHAPKDGRMCAGFIGVRAAHVATPLPLEVQELTAAWEYSPADTD